MKLSFDLYKRGKYFGVNIWYQSKQQDLFDDSETLPSGREYLTETQYSKIANWCVSTFNTKVYPMRARRMAYADFWFTSKRDLDWFILNWSSVDSDAV